METFYAVIEMQYWFEMSRCILFMNGDVLIVFIHRITHFYSHADKISFSKYFWRHFVWEKWDKCLKSQEVEETRNLAS